MLWDDREQYPMGSHWKCKFDDFIGKVIGYYLTNEGKKGVVLQQMDTRVVHVYGIASLEKHDVQVVS